MEQALAYSVNQEAFKKQKTFCKIIPYNEMYITEEQSDIYEPTEYFIGPFDMKF